MTTFEVTCSKCNGPIDFLYGDPTQPVCAGCHKFGYRCKCLAGPERPKVAAEAEQAVADRLRTALAALVEGIRAGRFMDEMAEAERLLRDLSPKEEGQ